MVNIALHFSFMEELQGGAPQRDGTKCAVCSSVVVSFVAGIRHHIVHSPSLAVIVTIVEESISTKLVVFAY